MMPAKGSPESSADKKEKLHARRRNTELKARRLVEPSSLWADPNSCIRITPSNCVNHEPPAPSLHRSDGRVAAPVPPAAKCAEGAHCSASRIPSGALHVISRDKKLTSRVQNVRQRNCAGLVGPLRKVARSRKRGNFTLQGLEAHLRLRKFHQCVLDVFRSSQGRLPIACKRFGISAARLGDLGCDLSKIEQAPPQRSRPAGLEPRPVKKRA